MMKKKITDFSITRQKVLNLAKRFSTFCFLDNHQYQVPPHSQECLLAAGIKSRLQVNEGPAFSLLQKYADEKKGNWLFGHLGYDLKNEIENLSSQHPDRIGFPALFFFEPEIVVRLSGDEIDIEAPDPQLILKEIEETDISVYAAPNLVNIRCKVSKTEYIGIINKLKEHILRGDCYEINFCQEFYAENALIDPFDVYRKLSEVSPNPFSGMYRVDEHWLICASPERFLRREGNRLLSQPIKGTSARVPAHAESDRISREYLKHSSKDRSENVMVVDLVRNDLAKVCKEGSVHVDELFGIYSFPQVHQMISTVSGELRDDISFSEIIKATFPMGSMTGAPKKKVMELIEDFEKTRRGIFSGALGYISPSGDFDFNVVIRSIMYNSLTQYLSFQAGSGITFYSDPVMEWEECLVKAAAMEKVLGIMNIE